MNITATGKCFYCSNPINRAHQPYVSASVRHNYKHGGTRISDRNFHNTCFDKFEELGGRPWNPETSYVVLDYEFIEPAEMRGKGAKRLQAIINRLTLQKSHKRTQSTLLDVLVEKESARRNLLPVGGQV